MGDISSPVLFSGRHVKTESHETCYSKVLMHRWVGNISFTGKLGNGIYVSISIYGTQSTLVSNSEQDIAQ